MSLQNNQRDKKNRVNGKYGIVAVAINAKIGSQNAVKWAIKHLLTRGETIALIHVKVKPAAPISISTTRKGMNGTVEECSLVKKPDEQTKEMFHLYRSFCKSNDIHCKFVVLEREDVSTALVEYIYKSRTRVLVLGPSNNGRTLFRLTDLVATKTPDVCTVFCISKEKIQFARSATKGPPPCKTIYEEETIICDLFKEEEEEEETIIDGLMQMPFASESILPSELPSSITKPQTVHLQTNTVDGRSSNSQAGESSVHMVESLALERHTPLHHSPKAHFSTIDLVQMVSSPITCHLEQVDVTLMGEINRAQIESSRTSLFNLANSAYIPQSRREIFNQIALRINDLNHKYNNSKEIYDHSSFDLMRLKELQEKRFAFQAFHLLALEAEMQATLRQREIADHMTALTTQQEIIKKEMKELTSESTKLSSQLTTLSDQCHKLYAETASLDNELVVLLLQKVDLKKGLRSGIE